MPNFHYVVLTQSGQKDEGTLEAPTQTDVVRILQNKGYLVLKITSTSVVGRIRSERMADDDSRHVSDIKRRSKTTSEDILLFFDQLGVLLDAGIDIIRALEIVSAQIVSKPLYDAILTMKVDVTGGSGLAEAMAKFPKFFPKYIRSIILIGEQSGELPQVTERVARNIERVDEVRQKIKKALTYPALLCVFSVIAVAVFLLKIIPTFVKIFKEFDLELPAMTKFVMNLSGFAQKYFFFVAAVFFVLAIIVRKLLQIPDYRWKFDKMILRVPFLGVLLLRSSIVSFTTSLELMLRNGVSMIEALMLAKDAMRNLYLESLIEKVKDRVREGASISSQIQKIGVFPPMVVQMIGVGEESGRLVEMLEKLSSFYNKRVADAVDRFAAVFEPLVLVFMGLIIGSLVIAMFLPIFKMASIGGG